MDQQTTHQVQAPLTTETSHSESEANQGPLEPQTHNTWPDSTETSLISRRVPGPRLGWYHRAYLVPPTLSQSPTLPPCPAPAPTELMRPPPAGCCTLSASLPQFSTLSCDTALASLGPGTLRPPGRRPPRGPSQSCGIPTPSLNPSPSSLQYSFTSLRDALKWKLISETSLYL